MPARSAAAKKKKTATSKKKPARAALVSGRGRASKKKSAAKSGARRGVSKKKTSKAASSRKKPVKKSAKKAASKKKVSRKKAASKKAVSSKRVTKKKAGAKTTRGKKAAGKSSRTQKTSGKKVGSKKYVTTKKAGTPGKKTPVAARKGTVSKKRPVPRSSTRRETVLAGPVRGFTPYQPKRGEDYMSDAQLDHFRHILLAWKRELMEEVDRTMHHMKDDAANFPDPNDRATQESEFGLELRTRDRERKLLRKIDAALQRIEDGSYGYCEETGDEIGLRRLEARPVATLCVEAQERRELAERQFRDREDYYR